MFGIAAAPQRPALAPDSELAQDQKSINPMAAPTYPLHAQPLPLWQVLLREMQLSPHALPAEQVLQQPWAYADPQIGAAAPVSDKPVSAMAARNVSCAPPPSRTGGGSRERTNEASSAPVLEAARLGHRTPMEPGNLALHLTLALRLPPS